MTPSSKDPSSTAIKIPIEEIDDYYSCSAYYGYRWYYGIIPNETDIPEILYSEAVVKAAKQIALAKKENNEVTWLEVRKLWDECLDEVIPRMAGKDWTKLSYYARGCAVLQRLLNKLLHVLHVDWPWEVMVKPGIYVTGTVDIIHQNKVDLYKGFEKKYALAFAGPSTWGANREAKLKPRYNIAPIIPRFYQDTITLEIMDTVDGTCAKTIRPTKESNVLLAKSILNNAVDAIMRRQYYPRPYSEACERCPFLKDCSIHDFSIDNMDKHQHDMAKRVINRFMRKKRKDAKRLIRRIKPGSVSPDAGFEEETGDDTWG